MGKTTILVVDDEPDMLRTMEFRLEAAGYKVLTSANGAQALETMRECKVDLVLADFMMPEMNGIELTRTVRSHPLWFDIKILLFSCNPEPEFRRKAMDLGAVDYLSKTVGAATIVDRVRQIKPPGSAAEKPGDLDEDDFRGQLASLSQTLVDMLHLAEATGEQPQASGYALQSARRIAEDIQRLTATSEPSE